MKIRGYYVCQDGLIWTVVERDGKYLNNSGCEVLLVNNDVYTGQREIDGGFMVNDEFTLWTCILELAKVLKG